MWDTCDSCESRVLVGTSGSKVRSGVPESWVWIRTPQFRGKSRVTLVYGLGRITHRSGTSESEYRVGPRFRRGHLCPNPFGIHDPGGWRTGSVVLLS